MLSSSFIMLFAFLIILPSVSESTHAEGDEPDEGITIVISPEINASLLSSEDGDYKIVKDTVTIGTDALNGYTLYISTDTPNHQTLYLNGDTSSENKINGATGTYESPKTLGDYEWGFAVPGVGHFDADYNAENPSNTAKFAILPTENKIIRDYTTSTPEDAAEVYYGFKLGGTIEPGAYETNITYTAVPAVQPLTAKAVLGNNGNLNFLYDRNTYIAGEIYTDNIDETTISNVYDVPTNSDENNKPGWTNNANILTANFDTCFYDFKPLSVAFWFKNNEYLSTITKPENLNTGNTTNMSYMLYSAGLRANTFNLDLSSWDTSNVTDMSYMFYDAGEKSATFSLDLSGWDTRRVANMDNIFNFTGRNSTEFALDLSSWKVSGTVSFSYMFSNTGDNAPLFSLDLSNWDLNDVTNTSFMFAEIAEDATTFNLRGLDTWKNTNNLQNTSFMFTSAGNHAEVFSLDLSSWNTDSLINTSYMFSLAGFYSGIFDIDLSGWNTDNVTNMMYMFDSAGINASQFTLNLSGWNTENVTNMSYMFNESGLRATVWSIGDISGWNVLKVTNHDGFISMNYPETNAYAVDNQPRWND